MTKLCEVCNIALIPTYNRKKCIKCRAFTRECSSCGLGHTSTYKLCGSCRGYRNNKNKCECGKIKTKSSKRCIECLSSSFVRLENISIETLENLLDNGLSSYNIAKGLGCSQTSIFRLLKKFNLNTKFALGELKPGPKFNGRSRTALECINNCIECGISIRVGNKYCSRVCQKISYKKLLEKWSLGGNINVNTITKLMRELVREEQNYTCNICGLGEYWNNKPLNLIMDHVDGNSENNTRKNIRLVCPNCDFQLPTSKGKNLGNGRFKRRQRYLENKSR